MAEYNISGRLRYPHTPDFFSGVNACFTLMRLRHKLPLMKAAVKKPAPEKKTGPEPEVLKLNGDWRELIKTSLQKKRPAAGWPK